MKSKTSTFYRAVKILLIVIVCIGFVLIAGAWILTGYAEDTITKKLKELEINAGSVDVNLLSRSIHLSAVSWTGSSDSVAIPHQAQIEKISVQGVGILSFLLNKKITVSKISIENGMIDYNKSIVYKKSKTSKSEIHDINVDQLVVKNILAKVHADSVLRYAGDLNFTVGDIELHNLNNPPEVFSYNIGSAEILVQHVQMNGESKLYKTSFSTLKLNTKKGEIEIDSLAMTPLKGKYEFANSVGKQKTRVVLQIPRITMTGFDYDQLRDSIFAVSRIEIHNADFSVFRDNRLPFKNPYIPLPVEMLKQIPFGLKLDSIKIIKSVIVHEEMAAQGVETGKINFTDVNASISNFNNRIYADRPQEAVINASCKFMKSGFIDATFHLPLKKGIDYKAQGKILHLDLREINTITETVAFLRVESGLMNRLNFNFHYNDVRSKGVLDINYENLVMSGLNKKDKKREINPFKTFLINTVVKKDKDKNTPKENRTGEIDVERDRHRFVVNMWVKSIFDGLKSVVLPTTQAKEKK